MSVNYTISGGGTIMTFDAGVTEILQADVQTYTQYLDLTTIVIPTSVVTICGTTIVLNPFTTDGAFSNMPNLTTVTINTPSSLKVIGKGAFAEDIGITGITLPAGLLYIGDAAFLSSTQHFPGMTINTIPSTVTYIGPYAFYADNGNVAFANLSTLPSAITVISEYAFYYVSIPTTLTIPSTVLDISNNAFQAVAFNGGTGSDCGLILSSGLKNIFSYAFGAATFSGTLALIIPPSTELIGDLAFTSTNLTDISYYFTTALGTDPFPIGATITILGRPGPPTDISGVRNPTSIYLSWTAPANTGNYPLTNYIVTDVTNDISYNTPNTNTNYTATGTDPNTVYTYSIQSVNTYGGISTASTSFVAGTVPGPPTNLSAQGINNAISLTWTAPVNTGGVPLLYYVITDTVSDISYNTPDTTTTYNVTGLTPNLTYTFVIQSVNNTSISIDSSDVSGIPIAPLGPPTSLSATPKPAAILLSWTAPIYTGGYPLAYYAIRDTSTNVVINTPTTDTSYNITHLSNTQSYTYVIKSVNTNADMSVDSSSVTATPLAPGAAPGVPRTLTATGGTRKVSLAWLSPTNSGGTPIYDYVITDVGSSTTYYTGNAITSYDVSGLQPNTTYTYRVQAINDGGTSGNSNNASATAIGATYTIVGTTMIFTNGTTVITQTDVRSYANYLYLTEVVIPTSCIEISGTYYNDNTNESDGAFSNMPINLRTITFNEPSSLTTIGTGAFLYDQISITLPTTLTYLGPSSFFGTSLTSLITIPPSIRTINNSSIFYLASFLAGDGTNGGLILSNGIQSIEGISAFRSSTFSGTLSVTIPPSVQIVGDSIFNYTNLTSATYTSTTQFSTDALTTFYPLTNFTVLPGPDPPTDISGIWNPTTIQLFWTAPAQTGASDISNYIILDTSTNNTYITPNSTTNYTITGTNSNINYIYTIRTVNEDGAISFPSSSFSIGQPPDPPRDVSAIGLPEANRISWLPPIQSGIGPIVSYILKNLTSDISYNVFDTSYTEINLVVGTTYTYTVQSINSYGYISIDSSNVSAIPLTPVPNPPTDLSAIGLPGAIDLSWNAPLYTGNSPIDYYIITDVGNDISFNTPNATTHYQITGLIGGNQYTYFLQTVNTGGYISTDSSSVSATVFLPPLPNPPSNITVTKGPFELLLQWTPPADTGGGPPLYYIITDVDTDISYNSTIGDNFFYASGLTAGQIYTYYIQTVNTYPDPNYNTSLPSADVSGVPGTNYPDPPSNLTGIGIPAGVQLTWTAPTYFGIGTFVRYVITDVNTPFTYYYTNGTSYNIINLNEGQTYTYYVQTLALSTEFYLSNPSNDASAIALAPPGPPQNLTASGENLAIYLSWLPPANATYDPPVYYRITDVYNDISYNTDTSATFYRISGLLADTTYTYRAQTIDLYGNISIYSNDASGTTLKPPPPNPPSDVSAIGIYQGVYLSWISPAPTSAYLPSYYIITDVDTNIRYTTAVGARTYTFSSLSPSNIYSYRIQTVDTFYDPSYNTSIPSPTVSARPLSVQQPDPPSNFSANPRADDPYSIDLAWTPPTNTGQGGILAYIITDLSSGIQTTVANNITTYSFSTSPNTNYFVSYVIQTQDNQLNLSIDSSEASAISGNYYPYPVTNFIGTSGPYSINLSWTPPLNTGGYPIQSYVIRNITLGIDYYDILPNDTSFNITGLSIIQSYTFSIRVLNFAPNLSNPTYVTATPNYPLPEPPTDLTITPEYIALYLTWTAPTTYYAPIDYYRITDVSNGTTYQAYDISYNFYPLTPGATYTYNVRTVDICGNVSVPTPDVSGIPLTPPLPDPPSNLEASGIILGVYLSWTAPPDTGGGPAIYYIITNVTTSTTINTPNADTSYNVTELSPGFSYTFQVQTVDLNGDTSPAYAGPVSATPLAPSFPDYPTDILAVPETLYIYLSWTAPINEGGGPPLTYIIRETDVNTSITTIFTTANTYYSDISANNPAHSYTYTLQTEDRFGRDSAESPATSAVSPYDLPSPPLNLTASGEILSVYLAWDVPTTIGQTAVAYYIITNVTNDVSFNTPNADTSYNVLDLSANVPFTFETQMVNTGGYISGFSNTAIGTPFEPPPPNPPTDVSAVGQADSIYLSWTPPVNTGGGPVAYYIITDVINDISYNTMSNNSFYTVTGLNVGQLYTYYIQTVDTYFDPALNTSVPSASVSATPVSAPNPPTDLSAGNFYFTNNNATAGFNVANQYSGIFTWTAPTFTGGFPISYYILTCTTITFPNPPLPISYQTPNADTSFNITLITGPLLNGINPFVCSIKTVNSNGDSSIDSSSITFNSPDFQTPDPAIDLSAVGLVDSIYVSWQPPVYTGNAPISYYSAIYFIDTSSNSGIIPGGWGSTLSFEVFSVYNLFNYPGGGSGPSAIVTATAIAPPLTDVSAVGFLSPPAAYPPGSINITWQYPFASVYNYAEITNISSGLVYTTGLNENFFTIDSTNFPDISTNTVYNYAVKGYIYNGGTETYATTNNSYVSAMIYLPNPPDPPTDLSGYATSYNSLYLQWVAPVNTGGSAIQYYYIRNTITGATNSSFGTDTSYNMLFSGTTRIQGDTLYTFVVVAVTVLFLESSDSNPVTIRTPQSPPPGPPVALVAQSYTPTSIQLNWYPPRVDGKNPIAYYIITNVTTGYSYPQTMGPEPTQAIIIDQGDPGFTPLQQRVLYTFYIVTVDDHDLSSVPSASVSAMLIPLPLLPPENIVAVPAPNSIILRWDTQINTGAYDLNYYLITDISSGRTYRSYPPYPAPFYQPEFIVFDLSADIPYTFYIQTVNTGLQISVPSTTITATPLEGPYPPTNIVATGLLESIYLTWDAAIIPPTSGFFYQYIITDVSSGETYRTPTYDPSVLSYTITNLQPAVARTYYIQTAFDSFVGIINSVPSPNVSAIPLPPFPDPPTNLLALGYVNSILLFWTPPPDTSGYNAYFYIVNTGDPGEYYTTDNATISNYNILGLDAGFTAIYEIKTIDLFDQSSNYAVFNSATAIPKIPLILNISGESVQTIPFMGTPIIPWYVTSIIIPSPYNAPPYPPNPVTGTPIIVYTDTLGNVLPDLPNSNGFYNVYAYISPNDPYYTGRSDTYTIFVKIALPQLLDCSPALALNALSHGGNFSSAITTAIGKQMSNTTVAAKVFAQTSAPVCSSCPAEGPSISPFSGGTTSGTHTNAIIQDQALCTYNQNLAVAKLRQIPGCPIDNAQRFAKYQRFASPAANCIPPVITSGLPTAINGPCTNVIGISQVWPP